MERSVVIALTILRIVVAGLMTVHGVSRIVTGGVSGFGEFLGTLHLPLPHVVAWVLSLVETIGGAVLAAGLLVRPLCLWLGVQLLVGIFTVHIHSGWFVVGGGRNGVEYSVLLIACLAVIAVVDRPLKAAGRQGGKAAGG